MQQHSVLNSEFQQILVELCTEMSAQVSGLC